MTMKGRRAAHRAPQASATTHTIQDLPLEVLELILELAARTGNRRKAALNLSLVSKQFHVPALRALYRDLAVSGIRQYEGLKAIWHRSPQQPPLMGTRRMFLVLRDPSEDEVPSGSLSMDQGVPMAAGKSILEATSHLRSLHMLLCSSPNELFVDWTPMPFLNRLHIDSGMVLGTDSLFSAMQTMPLLQRLFVCKLHSTGQTETPDLPRFPMRIIILAEATISDRDLLKLGASCAETLRDFSLLSCKTVSRRGIVDMLKMVGPGLNSCELRSCSFSDEVSNPLLAIGPFLDDIASFCPFLLELQIASDEICTPHILSRALLRLPLRHVELNCRLPHFEPAHLVDALRMVPIGRLETLFVGPHLKWNDEALSRVRRACVQQDIMFSSGLDLDLLGDPYVSRTVQFAASVLSPVQTFATTGRRAVSSGSCGVSIASILRVLSHLATPF